MFRESDPSNRQYHPSYTNKPISTLQLISQISKIDENAKLDKIGYQQNDDNKINEYIPPVPVKYDTYYDPNHPDADWSGLVSLKNNQRKHCNDHISQKIGIIRSEYGYITGKEDNEKKQNHNRRQQSIMDSSDANGLSSSSAISNKYNKSNLVIGGIDCKKENKYITEYNRFEKQEMTDKEQLIMEKRLKSVRMLPDPAQAKSRVNSSYDDNNIISSFNNNNNKTNNSGDSTILVSSDYRASTYATKSFISNIGTLIR